MVLSLAKASPKAANLALWLLSSYSLIVEICLFAQWQWLSFEMHWKALGDVFGHERNRQYKKQRKYKERVLAE